jgi:hypothetical protein
VGFISAATSRIDVAVAVRRRRVSAKRRPPRELAPEIVALEALERRAIAKLGITADNKPASAVHPSKDPTHGTPGNQVLASALCLLRFAMGILRSEVVRSADVEEAVLPWEDREAIENRLLRDELGLDGIALARVAEGIGASEQNDSDFAVARRFRTRREGARTKRVMDTPMSSFVAGLGQAGVSLTDSDRAEARAFVHKTLAQAVASPDLAPHVAELDPRRRRRKKR